MRSPHVSADAFACEVESWCPVEIDALPLGRRRALMARAEEYTVFVKNSIAFPYFGAEVTKIHFHIFKKCSQKLACTTHWEVSRRSRVLTE